MAIGLSSLGFFAYYEFQWSPLPLLPPRILKNRTIMCGSLLGFFHFLSQFVYESFFTSFLQCVSPGPCRRRAVLTRSVSQSRPRPLTTRRRLHQVRIHLL